MPGSATADGLAAGVDGAPDGGVPAPVPDPVHPATRRASTAAGTSVGDVLLGCATPPPCHAPRPHGGDLFAAGDRALLTGVEQVAGATAPPQAGGVPGTVVVLPSPSLRWLLPPRDREAGRRLRHDPDATAVHVVEAAGVPRTEVGALRRRGAPLDPAARLEDGDVVEVAPPPRPQPLPAGGLLLDVHLGTLARRLRLLGLDAADDPSLDDAGLVDRAAAEDRLLLTRDRGLLRRRALPAGALVRGDDPDDQLADVLDRFAPPLAPMTRCTRCGGRLGAVAKADVDDRLPAGTRRSYDDFTRCARCGHVFWRGAHAERLEALVARAAPSAGPR